MSAIESLKKRLKKDDTWKTFRSILDSAYPPEFENFGDEIIRLHKTREMRLLKRGNRASKLSDAALNDQATRSRAVEIAITITRNKNLLEVAVNNTWKYVEAHYTAMLSDRGAKTKIDQKAAIEACFKGARLKQEQMETLLEIADKVIEDIDKASFAIKHALDALMISTKREHAS